MFPYRVLYRDARVEWRVEKRSRVIVLGGSSHGNVRTDARLVRVNVSGEPKYHEPTPQPVPQRYRTDYRVYVKELGGNVYLHKAVGFAWRSSHYEDVGGKKKKLPDPLSWADFGQLGLQVHHASAARTAEIMVDSLIVCTKERNQEYENIRRAAA